MTPVVRQTGIELRPDPTRVITRFFVPGWEDVGPGDSRAASVIERVLSLSDGDVGRALADLDERFSSRHRSLRATLRDHATMVAPRFDGAGEMSEERLLLLGATFTHEYAIEGAALCNPSAVLHPQQDQTGDTRFVMSVRGIGEGHRSSIGFRTGRLSADGAVTIDPLGPFPQTSPAIPGVHHRSVFHARLRELDDDHENAAYVLDRVGPCFDDADLSRGIDDLAAGVATRRHTATTIGNLNALARTSYRVTFPSATDLSERVLWPQSPAESHGMEDARFVRFTHESGDIAYYGTYTAFDGTNICQHVVETVDFATFDVSPMAGAAAVGKGLALFPRRIDGRFVALSRSDRETNAIAFSDDLRCWTGASALQVPERPWEILQLGNCGSPIETDAGWLVLTHGVGPMRTYALGALLLDLDDPRHVLARSLDPILSPSADRRDGYVPNVVYSCGAFAHGDVLVLPFGVADQSIAVATLSIDALLAGLRPEP